MGYPLIRLWSLLALGSVAIKPWYWHLQALLVLAVPVSIRKGTYFFCHRIEGYAVGTADVALACIIGPGTEYQQAP